VTLTRRALVVRSCGFALALLLGAVGLWLVVTGQSQRAVRLGALASLWALLIGTFVMFGSRRSGGTAVDMAYEEGEHPSTELTPVEDAAEQREYEARLEEMLRREVQTTLAREMAFLRGELASLRTELLDKVGGQITLERIETTRIIGSDLEALQAEVRQLRERALHGEQTRLFETTHVTRPGRAEVVDAQLVETQLVETQLVDAQLVEGHAVEDEPTGYRGRRRRDDAAAATDDAPRRRGRHSPEGEELLARLLSRDA
jgi:hypothetical protein